MLFRSVELTDGKGLFLYGPPGVGRTYAMAALARHYIADGLVVARLNWEMLCLRIRDCFRAKADKTELQTIQPYLDAYRLFIEDIGTTKSEGAQESDFSVRVLLVILDYRIEHCLPTFFTTNRTIEELCKTFDARVASRIMQGCDAIKLSGEDKRARKEGIK